MSVVHDRQATAAFVSLADSLADGVDSAELLAGLTGDCARICQVAGAGLLLADGRGVLHTVAASSSAVQVVQSFQLRRTLGPCLDCYTSGRPVVVADLAVAAHRWPGLAAAAARGGLRSVHAVPIRWGEQVLGTLALFGSTVGDLDAGDVQLAQALAHVATIAVVQDRTSTDRAAVNAQLQGALDSRVVVEQAKGAIGQAGDLDMDRSFAVLRGYARDHNCRLSAVAHALTSRRISPLVLLAHAERETTGSRARTPISNDAGRRQP